MCLCKYCKDRNVFNINMRNEVNMSELHDKNSVNLDLAPLIFIGKAIYGFVKYVGIMLVGIVIGAGVVIKNPPENTELVKKIRELEAENSNIKLKLNQTEFTTKESIVIK